ncbi:cytochrome c oxidase assembly protein [Methylobacter sp. YRD-M1]|uniref:cytochrome c oxidase assembly protein n=1 Tax=Methylobacter sp. YRD-M1 TaxID=2911520 RepID=UPI00227D55B7|nr:cytochrome c oxidase assembly protein [Methylobacter sp. YRD-M1]WAK03939.1 cytochrome c oxidase assembly protein [Methylobacter sp. YRD-M1]
MSGLRLSVHYLLLTALAAPAVAHAHWETPIDRNSLWAAWNMDLAVLIPLGLSGGLYAAGLFRLWRHSRVGAGIRPREATAFAAGWLTLFIALVSPLDALSNELFAAHMVQHETMMLVAAPFLVASKVFPAWLWSLPAGWRRGVEILARSGPVAALWAFCTRPLAAWLIHALILWSWHIPFLFQTALGNNGVHILQHLGFLFSALLFWWVMVNRRHGTAGRLLGAFYIFTTAIHTSLLGALLTFAASPWYPVYAATAPAWGLSPVEDQQLGGLIMWVPGGAVFMIVTLLSLMRYFQEAEQSRDLLLAKRK